MQFLTKNLVWRKTNDDQRRLLQVTDPKRQTFFYVTYTHVALTQLSPRNISLSVPSSKSRCQPCLCLYQLGYFMNT
jgi:hypothetical protein